MQWGYLGDPVGLYINKSTDTAYIGHSENSIAKISIETGARSSIPAAFPSVNGIAMDSQGNLFYGSYGQSIIGRTTPEMVASIWAGSGVQATADGVGTQASIYFPVWVGVDSKDDLYFGQCIVEPNAAIRKVDKHSRNVTTLIMPTGSIAGIYLDENDNIWISNQHKAVIQKYSIRDGSLSDYAGIPYVFGYLDDDIYSSLFYEISGITVDGKRGMMYIAESHFHRVRKINMRTGKVSTVAGQTGVRGRDDGVGTHATFNEPMGLAVDSKGNLYVTDRKFGLIRKVLFCSDTQIFDSNVKMCKCIPGYRLDSSLEDCIKCPTGSFTDSASLVENCEQCPAGFTSNWNNTACEKICQSGTCKCKPGFQPNLLTGICESCPLGSYKPQFDSSECTACPAGFESSPNRTACTACPNGKYRLHLTATSCLDCPAYANCTSKGYSCDAGYFSDDGECKQCPVGTQSSSDGNGCIDCPTGYYRSNSETPACLKCPLNSGCSKSSFECNAGYQLDFSGLKCVKCSAGTFKSESGNHVCSKCPVGTEVKDNQSKQCSPCQLGKLRLSEDWPSCIACPQNAQCTADSFQCSVNYEPAYTADGYPLCEKCIAGTTKTTIGNHQCEPCSSELYASLLDHTCLKCPEGTAEQISPLVGCKKCDRGQQPTYFRSSCFDCPPHTYKSNDSAANCFPCPSGAVCTLNSFTCVAGFELSKDRAGCMKCDKNYYKPIDGNFACTNCPSGAKCTRRAFQCIDGWIKDAVQSKCIKDPSSAPVNTNTATASNKSNSNELIYLYLLIPVGLIAVLGGCIYGVFKSQVSCCIDFAREKRLEKMHKDIETTLMQTTTTSTNLDITSNQTARSSIS